MLQQHTHEDTLSYCMKVDVEECEFAQSERSEKFCRSALLKQTGTKHAYRILVAPTLQLVHDGTLCQGTTCSIMYTDAMHMQFLSILSNA